MLMKLTPAITGFPRFLLVREFELSNAKANNYLAKTVFLVALLVFLLRFLSADSQNHVYQGHK